MANAADLKVAENLVVLGIGSPGSGKSTALASFSTPEEPGYMFDIDHRIRGILGSRSFLGDDCIKSLDYDQYDAKDGFKEIEKQFMELSVKYDKRELKYKNLFIESVGSLSRMFIIDCQRLKGFGPGKDLSALKPEQRKGARIIGNIAMAGPDEYRYGSDAFHSLFYNYFNYFTKCNVFLSGWTTDKWGFQKDGDGNELPYADKIVVGSQLLATNKIASELPGYFDEIWEFKKEETGQASRPLRYTVTFRSAIAKTAIAQLPSGPVDITGKNFKKVFTELVAKGAK